MIYVPIRTDKADDLSRAIYQLMRPPATRNASDVSSHYCGRVEHSTRQEVVALVIPESETIPIHVAADGELLQSTLATFVPAELTQAEADNLGAAIVASAGSRITVSNMIPASWQPYVMNQAQAIAAGYEA